MARGPAISPEVVTEIRKLLAQGVGKRAIARRLGVSEMTVYRCRPAPSSLPKAPERPRNGSKRGGGMGSPCARAGGKTGEATERRTPAGDPGRIPDDAYPDALLRHVPRDYLAMLPQGHYLALVRAAAGCRSAAAEVSLRQALLLHGDPVIPPPTSIELALSEEEEAELRSGEAGGQERGGAEATEC
jgi:hypothetical protein